MVTNHTIMMGPKTPPVVPSISIPSTALKTEMEGVITAVAIEERRAEQPQGDDPRRNGVLTVEAANSQNEGEQSENAAFSMVVESHDEHDVLDTDDQEERPDDERQHAVHGSDVEAEAVLVFLDSRARLARLLLRLATEHAIVTPRATDAGLVARRGRRLALLHPGRLEAIAWPPANGRHRSET